MTTLTILKPAKQTMQKDTPLIHSLEEACGPGGIQKRYRIEKKIRGPVSRQPTLQFAFAAQRACSA